MSSKNRRDPKGDGEPKNKNEPAPPPATPSADEYGKEGTNKTIAQPKADNAPSEELGNTPHVGKTPYTRG
jgi:hypothetical protein